MQAHRFSSEIRLRVDLNYLLYLPPDYESRESWPLILFLHGRGERGDDLEQVKLHGLPRRIAQGDHFPFIIVAPQCPASSYWTEELDALNALLDEVIAHYLVDSRRIYLTGLSMGGRGTWFLAGRYPERFAAIAPICGVGLNWQAQERLTNLPVWAFHGEADSVNPVTESINMIRWLREAGGNARLTLYPGVDHDSWTETYHNPELYDWFLSHSR
ncbi:MAG: prolyl oligopeptidase family serine peptidase [Anaerolineae bacterium]|nr:prolyl oligopeptidase family serine peptidase [Anaerolineae bacterium]